MIKEHIHVDVCDSTQDLLKEQLSKSSDNEFILVSCEHQSAGKGRGENIWTALSGTLCFSMNIEPGKILSFTAIELSVIIARYFESQGQTLKLKWPNDLWDQSGRKCGGILVQGKDKNLLAGIGLNISIENKDFGSIYDYHLAFDKKSLASDLASYIHNNRYTDMEELKSDWLKRCGHLNKNVTISEGADVSEGIFLGLGEFGEALVNDKKFYNGSLRLK